MSWILHVNYNNTHLDETFCPVNWSGVKQLVEMLQLMVLCLLKK